MELSSPSPAGPALPLPALPETAAEAARCAPLHGPLGFPAGLPGFSEFRSFRLEPLGPAAGDFLLLACEEEQGPRFIVLPVREPAALFGDALVAEAAALAGVEPDELCFLLLVTLVPGPGGREAFVNLRAPLLVDLRHRLARQLVLADARLPLRHRLERRAAA
ncbi:MAG: flagellar assembly protein FliW [Geminicoccaceae bacterium]|nr:flagellar assembly protein FliW [Geminicoccaceae bacterium]MDW8369602.1 flagellar assembly protein FliW [Geminicoccaceae bacterium]